MWGPFTQELEAGGGKEIFATRDLQKDGVDVMASMFEKDTAGFTEDFDPNAEPGDLSALTEAEEAPAAEASEEA